MQEDMQWVAVVAVAHYRIVVAATNLRLEEVQRSVQQAGHAIHVARILLDCHKAAAEDLNLHHKHQDLVWDLHDNLDSVGHWHKLHY